MIWDHDRYVKVSPGYTLQDTSNGFTIFVDLGRKAGNFSASKEILTGRKIGFEAFLKNIENPCLDPKHCSQIILNRKSTPESYFQAIHMKGESQKVKKFYSYFISVFQTNFQARFLQ